MSILVRRRAREETAEMARSYDDVFPFTGRVVGVKISPQLADELPSTVFSKAVEDPLNWSGQLPEQ